MKTCHQEVTGLLNKANCILMCWNYLLLIMHYKFTAKMFDTSVHLKVDNTESVAWINKQTASTELEFSIVKQIWNFAAQRNLEICASYIESKKNKIAS